MNIYYPEAIIVCAYKKYHPVESGNSLEASCPKGLTPVNVFVLLISGYV